MNRTMSLQRYHFQAVLWIQIRIRIRMIRMYLGLSDPHPDPLVTIHK